jgi:hypothetical protein
MIGNNGQANRCRATKMRLSSKSTAYLVRQSSKTNDRCNATRRRPNPFDRTRPKKGRDLCRPSCMSILNSCQSMSIRRCYQRPSCVQLRSVPVRRQYPGTDISLDPTSVSGDTSTFRMLYTCCYQCDTNSTNFSMNEGLSTSTSSLLAGSLQR